MIRTWGGVILLLVNFSGLASQELMTPRAIEGRIKPVGQVTVTGEDENAQAASSEPVQLAGDVGKKRYKTSCSVCHDAGVAGAPKFGDQAAWAPRIAEGMETLVHNAIHGIRAMPPRGTCMNCSDDEIAATVKYMVDKAS